MDIAVVIKLRQFYNLIDSVKISSDIWMRTKNLQWIEVPLIVIKSVAYLREPVDCASKKYSKGIVFSAVDISIVEIGGCAAFQIMKVN